MDKTSIAIPQDLQRRNMLFDFIDEIKLNIELEFANFAGILEDWITKIQSFVTHFKQEESAEEDIYIKKLGGIRSSFVNLLDVMDEAKLSAMSVGADLLESLHGHVMLAEDKRQLESNKIKLDFVKQDSAIGGLTNGIIHIPHHQFLITGHNSGDVSVWNKNSLHLIHQFKAHESPITTISYMEEEKLFFTASLEGKAKVYNCHKFPEFQHIKTLNFERKKPIGILPLPEWNFVIILCKEGYLYILNIKDLKLIKMIKRQGQLDSSILYIKELKAIAIGQLGNDTVELISPHDFKTMQVIEKKFMIQSLKGVQFNHIRNELLVSFAYKIIKIYHIENGKAVENRELFIDKPFPSKIDFINEDYMVFASFSDKLDFIKVDDGQPVKSLNLGFTFSDFLLLREERKIIVFPYQSSETSIAVIEY
jgi:WD40 repeat protein